jgi:hypothetical protein
MNAESLDDILDNLFHGCVLVAFIEQAAINGGPSDIEGDPPTAHQLDDEVLAGNDGKRAA